MFIRLNDQAAVQGRYVVALTVQGHEENAQVRIETIHGTYTLSQRFKSFEAAQKVLWAIAEAIDKDRPVVIQEYDYSEGKFEDTRHRLRSDYVDQPNTGDPFGVRGKM